MKTSQQQSEKYLDLIRKRATHIPLQHLTGVQEFMGMDFIVNENVLIPRQDTEILVEEVIKYIRGKDEDVKLLDMCTGSGCIAVSIDKFCENATVIAVDISKKALAVAEKNNLNHHGDVKFIRSNLFENIQEKFDIIVSNPPYIETAEIGTLMPEVRDYEPKIALDGTEDGLEFYRIICDNLKKYLSKEGVVFFEIGYNQGEAVSELLKTAGFENIKIIKDLSKNDRVIFAKRM
jgi:release factor glutamine methyltransferase